MTLNHNNGASAPGENKMRLYVSKNNQWTGTQSDAKALGSFDQIEVPTDKPGLMEFLNNFNAPQLDQVDTTEPVNILSNQSPSRDKSYPPENTIVGKCSIIDLKELSTTLRCLLNKTWNEMENKQD